MTVHERVTTAESLVAAGHVVSNTISDSLLSTLPGCSYVSPDVFAA